MINGVRLSGKEVFTIVLVSSLGDYKSHGALPLSFLSQPQAGRGRSPLLSFPAVGWGHPHSPSQTALSASLCAAIVAPLCPGGAERTAGAPPPSLPPPLGGQEQFAGPHRRRIPSLAPFFPPSRPARRRTCGCSPPDGLPPVSKGCWPPPPVPGKAPRANTRCTGSCGTTSPTSWRGSSVPSRWVRGGEEERGLPSRTMEWG